MGWFLFDKVKQMQSNSVEFAYNDLFFSEGAGIDVMGNKIESIAVNMRDGTSKGIAAFLLRNDTIDDDIMFWNEVYDNLSAISMTRLIGYCENDKCIEFIKKNPDKVHFTVLEYGGVVDMQAVIRADVKDEFWLNEQKSQKTIKWRNGMASPIEIVKDVNHEK
jgi:hypothetical protein